MLRWAMLLALASGGCSWILPLNDLREDGGSAVEAGVGEGGTQEIGADDALTGDVAGPGDALSGEGTTGPGDGSPDAAVDCLVAQGCTSGWCKLTTGTTALHDLWGTGLTNLWAVGEQGTVLRFVRSACTWTIDTTVPTAQKSQTFLAVAGDGTTVFVGGTGGALLEWTQAGGWVAAKKDTPLATVTDSVRALAVAGTGEAFAAGGDELNPTSGFVWKRTSGVWTGVATSPTVRFHALSAGPGAVYAGGVGSLQVLDPTNPGNGFQTVPACAVGSQQQINGLWSNGLFYTSPAFALTAVGFDYQSNGRVQLEGAGSGCSSSGSSNQPAWNDVDGLSATDRWWVGDLGWVEQAGGGPKNIATADLNAVWVNPDTTSPLVVVAGDKGEVWARTY